MITTKKYGTTLLNLRSSTASRTRPWPITRVSSIRCPSTCIHPIFITVFSIVVGKLGLKSIYRYVAPIVVYCATLTFLIILQKVKIAMKSK